MNPRIFFNSNRKILKPMAFLLFIIIILGCPPHEWREIKYYSDRGTVKKFEVELANNECTLVITGKRHRLTKSILHLFIKAYYERGKAANFRFNLTSLKLLVNKEELPFASTKNEHQPNSQTRSEYLSPVSELQYYDFYPSKNELSFDDSLWTIDQIEIVLDSFVFYKDSVLLIDTIRGEIFRQYYF